MTRSLVCGLLLFAAAPAWGQFQPKPAAPQGATAPAEAGKTPAAAPVVLGAAQVHRYQVGFRVTAVGGPCVGLFGAFPLPGEWPEQTVKQVGEEFSAHVRRTQRRTLDGVEQLTLEIPQLPGGEQAVALLTYEVTRHALPAPSQPEELALPKTLPRDLRPYLAASPQIETINAKIKALAKELSAGVEQPYAQAEKFYDGVRERVQVEPGKLAGAAQALKEGQGPREDVTGLFIALCRAGKIPARMVWVTDGCYAEFYLQRPTGEGVWIPCNLAGEAKEFAAVSERKIILMKGDNFSTPEQKEPQRRLREYFTGKGGRPQLEIVRRLEDNAAP